VGRKKREKNIENRETAVIDGCFLLNLGAISRYTLQSFCFVILELVEIQCKKDFHFYRG
jgi:hypothetical protein